MCVCMCVHVCCIMINISGCIALDVDIRTEDEFTPLHYAAKYLPHTSNDDEAADVETSEVTQKSSSARAIGLLLYFGADVNAKDDDGLSPLAIACQRGNYFGVEALLKSEQIEESTSQRSFCLLAHMLHVAVLIADYLLY